VIAIQRGTEFPDEYVVCGAHYDSYSFESSDFAPGADDDASGTAGILETARILSQYDFKRSIIYCAFSAEEYGLFGSGYFAEKCALEDMNIVGYFNLDMTGYLKEGDNIHLSLIYPKSALLLANYFVNVGDVYFPEVPIEEYSNLPWGDSDHTSFNNMGYMGVWHFEDIDYDSPYIHSPDDIIGPSVNNPEQVNLFTQVHLACITTLAMYDQEMPPPPLTPPTDCVAAPLQKRYIKINWKAPVDNSPKKYNVYKDDAFIKQVESNQLEYVYSIPSNDIDVHCYKVTAIYGVKESDFSNESCTSINSIVEFDSKVNIYPNPATGELTIDNGQLTIVNVEVFDIYGRKCHLINSPPFMEARQPKADGVVLDISHLPAGLYFIKINNEFAGKFIKN
jgi:hypothetical protein